MTEALRTILNVNCSNCFWLVPDEKETHHREPYKTSLVTVADMCHLNTQNLAIAGADTHWCSSFRDKSTLVPLYNHLDRQRDLSAMGDALKELEELVEETEKKRKESKE